ncbi:MAG TPA: hypothetical protein VJ623_10190 [Holophagaceae bacterium]|nr:hypothetical protein [Holophagaceae bacterium]
MLNPIRLAAIPALATLTFLLACGGGSSGSDSAATPTPAPAPKVVYFEVIPLGTTNNYALRSMLEDGTQNTLLDVFSDQGGEIVGFAGDRFIFAEHLDNMSGQYYTVKADGSGKTRLGDPDQRWKYGCLVGDQVLMQHYDSSHGYQELYAAPTDAAHAPVLVSLAGEVASTYATTAKGVVYSQRFAATNTYEVRYRELGNGSAPVVLFPETADQEWFREVVGDRVLYTTLKGVYSVRLDGTDRRSLATVPDALAYQGVVGKLAIYANQNARGGDLFAVPVDGSGPARTLDATPDTRKRGNQYIGQPLVSDGTHLVYFRVPTGMPALIDLYSVPLTGGSPVRLTSFPEMEYPLAIVNGKALIARAGDTYQGNWDLYWVPLDGSDSPTPVVQTPQRELFLTLLDGRLVFRRLYADREELRSATLDGQDERLLATAPTNAGDAWAREQHGRIYVTLEATPGNYDFFSLKADGTDRRDLAVGPHSESFQGVL